VRKACVAIVLLWVSSCGAKNEAGTSAPPEPERAKPENAPEELRPPDPAPQLDAAPTPEPAATTAPDAAPAPKPKKKRVCKADAEHCCLRDGTIVKPGGCQPIYPEGVRAATKRGARGWCEPVECNVRCLPGSARIATPRGDVPIADLHAGDEVWTLDGTGARVAAPIVRIRSTPVPDSHPLVELTLTDGRRVRASAGHPTADGTALDSLRPGDALDGSTVAARRVSTYDGGATWDLLPAGDTGAYWADGVLLGSTLESLR